MGCLSRRAGPSSAGLSLRRGSPWRQAGADVAGYLPVRARSLRARARRQEDSWEPSAQILGYPGGTRRGPCSGVPVLGSLRPVDRCGQWSGLAGRPASRGRSSRPWEGGGGRAGCRGQAGRCAVIEGRGAEARVAPSAMPRSSRRRWWSFLAMGCRSSPGGAGRCHPSVRARLFDAAAQVIELAAGWSGAEMGSTVVCRKSAIATAARWGFTARPTDRRNESADPGPSTR